MSFEEQLKTFNQISYLWLLLGCVKPIQFSSKPPNNNIRFTVDLLVLPMAPSAAFSTYCSERNICARRRKMYIEEYFMVFVLLPLIVTTIYLDHLTKRKFKLNHVTNPKWADCIESNVTLIIFFYPLRQFYAKHGGGTVNSQISTLDVVTQHRN